MGGDKNSVQAAGCCEGLHMHQLQLLPQPAVHGGLQDPGSVDTEPMRVLSPVQIDNYINDSTLDLHNLISELHVCVPITR